MNINKLENPPRLTMEECEKRYDDYNGFAISYFDSECKNKQITIPFMSEDEVFEFLKIYASNENLKRFVGLAIVPMFFLDSDFYGSLSCELIDDDYLEMFRKSDIISLDFA